MRSRHLPALTMLMLSATANAQFVDDRTSTPLFGGAGNYLYPVLCTRCRVWQDYRNFAWNQLTINGGTAHTPTNPGNQTAFRIYTHATDDLSPALVEIQLVTIDIQVLGNIVGHAPTDHRHYAIETHPENGDNVPTAILPKTMGPLVFPYTPASDPLAPVSGSGGTTSRGESFFRGALDGSGGSGFLLGRGGLISTETYLNSFNKGNFCGAGTDYICVQF